MKVLVVGAGFMGAGIANRFARQDQTVNVLAPRRNSLLVDTVGFVHGRVELGSHISELLSGIDVVVDAASSHVPATVQDSPATATATSVGASAWLAEQAVNAGVECFVYLSSGGTVYGGGSVAHRELDRPDPISSYGAMKLASEHTISAITRGTRTRAIYLRVANAYGPGQNLARPQGIIGVAWRNHFNGEATTLFGAKSDVRDFIYIDDVGDLCVIATRSGATGAINAGSGHAVSMEDLLIQMSAVAGVDLKVVPGGSRGFDVPHSVLDIGIARGLGWEPRVPLREGLTRTWRWMKDAATG